MFAVRVRVVRTQLSMSSQRLVSNLRACARTGSAAARSVRPLRSYRVPNRRLELWTRRRSGEGCVKSLMGASFLPEIYLSIYLSDTRTRPRARKVEDETSSFFARKNTLNGRHSIVEGCYRGPSGGAGKVLVPARPRI